MTLELMRPRGPSALPTGTLTFLFTDIEGSTRLLAAQGEAYRGILERHAAILRDSIAARGGVEVSTEGDSFFAVFTSAPSAVAAAVDAQRALGDEAWPSGAAVRVRMGLHTGEGRLGGDSYVGMDVHIAARIGAVAHGGQVLISSATHELIKAARIRGTSTRELGPHPLKDLGEPIRLWQLVIEGLEDEFPPLPTAGARRMDVPTPMSSFVGREREIAAITDLLGQSRLVSLIGPGGAGKTRLALEVAKKSLDRFADGATFVDLSASADPALVPVAIAQALHVAIDPGGDVVKAIVTDLRDREFLLILDNFEQVADAAPTVQRLLADAPRLTTLVTSREPLGVSGEQEYDVPPFATDESIGLFMDRARAVRPDFEARDDNAETVAAIMEHIGGLPLAIELAASVVKVLDLATLRERLERHLPIPSGGGRGRPERQHTMRDAIGWSYALLTDSERRLFTTLSILPGGFSVDIAEAVGGTDGIILDGIAALVTKSLVRRTDAADGQARFGMLEPIREFAEERLRADFDYEDTMRRVASHWLGFADGAAPQLVGHDQARWLDGCQREMPNVRRVLDWAADAGEVDAGLRIATGLWRYWQQRGPIWEGRRALDRLLALGGSPSVRGRALGAASGLAWWDGDFVAAQRHAEDALPLLEGSDDRIAEASALYDVAFVTLWQAVLHAGEVDADRSEGLFRRSLAIAEELGDRRTKARALRGLGQVRGIARGDAAGAVPMFQESLDLATAVGDRWEMNESVVAVANGRRFSGDLAGAKRAYLDGIDLMAEAGNRQTMTGLLYLLAALEVQLGNHRRVARLWGAAQGLRESSGAITPPSGARLIGDPEAAARAAIGDEEVDRELSAGKAMGLEELVAYAHEAGEAPVDSPG